MNFKSHLDKFEVFKKVADAAANLGIETYVVGGYVRDLILNRECKDIDFTCVGNGIELAKEVGKQYD
ncbi:MAG: tRNA nucleotidyltransferase, partial [Algoriphagus sp.]